MNFNSSQSQFLLYLTHTLRLFLSVSAVSAPSFLISTLSFSLCCLSLFLSLSLSPPLFLSLYYAIYTHSHVAPLLISFCENFFFGKHLMSCPSPFTCSSFLSLFETIVWKTFLSRPFLRDHHSRTSFPDDVSTRATQDIYRIKGSSIKTWQGNLSSSNKYWIFEALS